MDTPTTAINPQKVFEAKIFYIKFIECIEKGKDNIISINYKSVPKVLVFKHWCLSEQKYTDGA